jgi:hypothetical protein
MLARMKPLAVVLVLVASVTLGACSPSGQAVQESDEDVVIADGTTINATTATWDNATPPGPAPTTTPHRYVSLP